MNRREAGAVLLSLGTLGVAARAMVGDAAETYPSKPIKIVVAYAAGSVLDIWARRVSEKLSKSTGQQVIVENRPGASGTLSASAVANSSPDGYTILFGGTAELALAPSLFPNLPYEKDKPFEPITRFLSGNSVLVANPALPVANIQELVAYGKAHPGTLKGGSPGNGTLTHLLLLALNHATGLEILHVPYKSGTQGLTDVMAGHIDLMFDWITSSKAFIAAGKLKPLLIAGSRRKPLLPNVPAATEFGWKDLDFGGFSAFLAPFGTPKAIIYTLHRELLPILRSKDFEADIALFAVDLVTTTPDELATFIASEKKRYKSLVRLTGVKLE